MEKIIGIEKHAGKVRKFKRLFSWQKNLVKLESGIKYVQMVTWSLFGQQVVHEKHINWEVEYRKKIVSMIDYALCLWIEWEYVLLDEPPSELMVAIAEFEWSKQIRACRAINFSSRFFLSVQQIIPRRSFSQDITSL